MPVDLAHSLVVAISSRALFDLSHENRIFEDEGLEAFCAYQREHEKDVLTPGVGFALVKTLLELNREDPVRHIAEVVVVSHNSADTSLRIFHSIEHYGLSIGRAAFTSGGPVAQYLDAFDVDLFLSADEKDVRAAIDTGIAAGVIYEGETPPAPTESLSTIRIAFDGDAVIFNAEAEEIYQRDGLEAFGEHEKKNAEKPLPAGPFAKLLKTLSYLQHEADEKVPAIHTALVTARGCPAHERVIRTLRAWNVRIDETFFLGGVPKDRILQAFGAHIFFDDQEVHCQRSRGVVPTARVPSG